MFDIWCRWMFYLFLHKIVVYMYFFIFFNVASKMAAKGHVTILIIVGSKKVLNISNLL